MAYVPRTLSVTVKHPPPLFPDLARHIMVHSEPQAQSGGEETEAGTGGQRTGGWPIT